MPSKSQAQHNLMEGAAHSPAFAKKVGVPQSVGKEFVSADKMKAQAKALRKKPAPKTPDYDNDGY